MVTKRRANRDNQPFQTVWYCSINSQVYGAEKKGQKFLNTYGNVAYEKGDVSNQWGKDGIFIKWFWDNQVAIWKKKNCTFHLKTG